MFENIAKFFKKLMKSEAKEVPSKETAKERLHLVLMQDRANVSADFLELMKQEIIEVIKKYIEVEEAEIDVRLTNEVEEDGTQGAPSLYANIPILKIKNDVKKENTDNLEKAKQEDVKELKEKPAKAKNKKVDIKVKEISKIEESEVVEENSSKEEKETENKEETKDEQEHKDNQEKKKDKEKPELEEDKKSESEENKELEIKEGEEKKEIEE